MQNLTQRTESSFKRTLRRDPEVCRARLGLQPGLVYLCTSLMVPVSSVQTPRHRFQTAVLIHSGYSSS